MISEQDIGTVVGAVAVDSGGGRLGAISEVHVDSASGCAAWATVRTGVFGTKGTMVPLAEAELAGNVLRLPYGKAMVRAAPVTEAVDHLSPAEEAELQRYYGLSTAPTGPRAPRETTDADAGSPVRSGERRREVAPVGPVDGGAAQDRSAPRTERTGPGRHRAP